MKTAYNLMVLRYVHDVITGEFANVGVVLYAPENCVLRFRFSASCERLDAMFLETDHEHFSAMMRYMAEMFAEMGARLQNNEVVSPASSLAEMVKQILPPDDSSLRWSEQGGGFTDDPEKTLNELYCRLVERYRSGASKLVRVAHQL